MGEYDIDKVMGVWAIRLVRLKRVVVREVIKEGFHDCNSRRLHSTFCLND